MSSRKKLFESEDFDKKKKLFSPEDFDKESDATVETEGVETGNTPVPTLEKPNSKTWIKGIVLKHKILAEVILGLVVGCIIGYFILSKSGDTTVSELAQETEIGEESKVPTDSVIDQEQVLDEVLPNKEECVSNSAGQDATVSNEPEAPVNLSNNATAKPANNADVSNDVEAEAMKVIRGDYGVGQVRKDKLGSKYQTIQSRVNELKREGIF